jgi:PRC-barrel domain
MRGDMHKPSRWVVATAALVAVMAAPACDARARQKQAVGAHPATRPAPAATPPASAPEQAPAAQSPAAQSESGKAGTLAITFDTRDVQAVLGKDVRSSTDEDMGRLVDVVVDRDGQPRAAIIDFGGFLGVGSRKIAVDWGALNFSREAAKGVITVELTRDQVKAAPEFKDGSPVVVLGALTSIPPGASARPAPSAPASKSPQTREK